MGGTSDLRRIQMWGKKEKLLSSIPLLCLLNPYKGCLQIAPGLDAKRSVVIRCLAAFQVSARAGSPIGCCSMAPTWASRRRGPFTVGTHWRKPHQVPGSLSLIVPLYFWPKLSVCFSIQFSSPSCLTREWCQKLKHIRDENMLQVPGEYKTSNMAY